MCSMIHRLSSDCDLSSRFELLSLSPCFLSCMKKTAWECFPDFSLEFLHPQWKLWVANHKQTRSYLTLQRHGPLTVQIMLRYWLLYNSAQNAGSGSNSLKRKKKKQTDSSFGRDKGLQHLCAYRLTAVPVLHAANVTCTELLSTQQQVKLQITSHRVNSTWPQRANTEIESKHSCTGTPGLSLLVNSAIATYLRKDFITFFSNLFRKLEI